jgi:DNA-binding response OmpR family regulator
MNGKPQVKGVVVAGKRGLPELDGLEVACRVRSEGHGMPILILTARADE